MSFFQKLFKPKAKRLSEPAGTPATAPIVSQAVSPPPRPATPAPAVAVVALAPVPSPVPPTQPAAAHRANRWQNVYVFISSTFNDMHAERDYLVKQVFPQLQEWCERRKLRLVDIDLRWGVTEQDATENKRVVQVCLERIDACRPFFFCFLGQRRGWVPGEGDISAQTYENYPALKQKNYVGTTSVTEMEILHALVDPLHQGHPIPLGATAEHYERVKYAFFYLRQPEYLNDLPTDPPQLRQVYTNEAIADAAQRAEADSQLQLWRETTIPSTGRPAHPYMAHWGAGESTPEIRLPLTCPSTAARDSQARQAAHAKWARQWAQAGVQVDENGEISDPVERAKAEAFNSHLIQGRLADFTCRDHPLAETIIADLQAAIHERYPEHVEVASASLLQRELDQQEQALRLASEGFIERAGNFAALDDYVNGPSDRLFVLTAQGGLGKTSLLAKWIDRTALNLAGGESLHYRFIGASDGSTTVDALLRSVLREIQEIVGKLEAEIPSDPNKMRMELPKLLEAAGKQGKVVIVLDGLNQLESKLSDLAWLPQALPANVKLVVSFKRGEAEAESYFEQLQARGNVILAEVKPFESLADRRQLVQVYLSQFLKELDERPVESLIHSKGAGNPLYLKVVLSELRVFGAFADLGEKIRADFGTDPTSAFRGVLKRLESDPAYSPVPPELLVPRVFGWLAHARQGLSVEELGGLLIQDGLLPEDADGKRKAEEAVHGLLRQVRPYLARRDGRADFFYESFKLAAMESYVREAEKERESNPQARQTKAWHATLAEYFERQPLRVGAEQKPNLHTLAELAFQNARAGQSEALKSILWDYRFMEARLEGADVATLIADYDLLTFPDVQLTPDEASSLRLLQEALRLSAHVVGPDPAQLPSQLTGRLLGFDDELIRGLLAQARRETEKPWLRPLTPDLDAPGGSLVRTLTGHTDSVTGVALTADGRLAVSASWDGTLKVWDVASGREQRTLTGHTAEVNAVALTADGRLAVSASKDGTLKVWDVASGQELRTLAGYGAVALTADGRLAVSDSSESLKVWDVASGQALRTLAGHDSYVTAVALTADGRLAVSASNDLTLKVWDVASGRELRTLVGHTSVVRAVALTPDGRLAVSAAGELDGEDIVLKVWDVASGQDLRTLAGHHWRVTRVALTADGRMAVSASWDGTLKMWEVASGRELCTLTSHGLVTGVALTADGRMAVSASGDHTLKVWDISAEPTLSSVGGTQAEGPNARMPSGQALRTRAGHAGPVTAVALSADGRLAVSASVDSTFKVWDVASGTAVRTLHGDATSVIAVALTADGRLAVSAAHGSMPTVWDVASGRLLRTLREDFGRHPSLCYAAVALTADGRLAVSDSSETLKVWDVASGQALRTLAGHAGPVTAVALTPDGRLAVSASRDKTLKVWDVASGRELRTLVGHTSVVRAVALTPDGRLAVSASRDKTLKVWDVASGRELRTLTGHTDWITSVAPTPDGRLAIAASWDKTLRVWDVASGEILASYTGEEAAACFAANGVGGVLLTGDEAGRMHFLRLENVVPGPARATAWCAPRNLIQRIVGRPAHLAFGCTYCRTWSEIPASALGMELPCPHSGTVLRLNPFVIEADWRPVAAVWRGEP